MVKTKQEFMEALRAVSTEGVDFDLVVANRSRVDPSYFKLECITSDRADKSYANFREEIVQSDPKGKSSLPEHFGFGLHTEPGFVGSDEKTVPELVEDLCDMGYTRFVVTTHEGLTNYNPRETLSLDEHLEGEGKGLRKFFHGIDWTKFTGHDLDKRELLESAGFPGVFEVAYRIAQMDGRVCVELGDIFSVKVFNKIYALSEDNSRFVVVTVGPKPPEREEFDFRGKVGYHNLIQIGGTSSERENYEAFKRVLEGFKQKRENRPIFSVGFPFPVIGTRRNSTYCTSTSGFLDDKFKEHGITKP